MIRPTMPWRDSTSTGWEAPIRVEGFPAATLVRRARTRPSRRGRLEIIADFGDQRLAFTEPGTDAA